MATSIPFLEKMQLNPDIRAAEKTVRHTEGTSAEDGYGYLFGSNPNNTLRFSDFRKHPNILQTHNGISSTAAGAYQILHATYEQLCAKYGFTDFTPHTQDLMCAAIFDEINDLVSISNGEIVKDLPSLCKQWASLPGAGYGQPTHSMADVQAFYLSMGGSIA